MSALKHGLYRLGFMLCDRCVVNATCGRFQPGGECGYEKETFSSTVERLVEDYGLEGVADRIMAERAAMYLIRIARAENYEAKVGVSDRSALWGGYIATLDRMLQAILGELAVTRRQRIKLEGEEALMVNVESLLKRLKSSRGVKVPKTVFRPVAPLVVSRMREREALEVRNKILGRLLEGWLREKSRLKRLRKASKAE
ncbi:hypothetical protein [Candidatus Hecatella orcuttiae]|uniref:hypothetical protein n=1 Tax=Candidatus Hecatella orcuttiae TaxID=1935119 RepID=UPI00286838F0|nr:hypothetical protein [Candidatus Hecatella orcuttiae]